MGLKEELGLSAIATMEHEAALCIYLTGDLIKKRARDFFRSYNITDVQFNVLDLLSNEAPDGGGLTQARLGRMMVVKRSNVTSILDRMERDGLVERIDVPGDRRYNEVRLTDKGRTVVAGVKDAYMSGVQDLLSDLSDKEMSGLMDMLGRIRRRIWMQERKG
jgi:DNA-binding MarR family transcriptional regulator